MSEKYGPLPEHLPFMGLCYTADQMRAYAAQAVAAERERCAKQLQDAAARLLAPKRTNNVDRHTADVLLAHAARIRNA